MARVTLKLLPPAKPVSADQILPCESVYSPPPAFTRMVPFSHTAAWVSPFARVTPPAAVPWLLMADAPPLTAPSGTGSMEYPRASPTYGNIGSSRWQIAVGPIMLPATVPAWLIAKAYPDRGNGTTSYTPS